MTRPSTAQAIGNPLTLGGYANQPGSGAPGRSLDGGDTDDFFRVELLAGQRVTMLVADYAEADADLYLYDLQGNVLDFSLETGEARVTLDSRRRHLFHQRLRLRRRHQLHTGRRH